MSTLEIILRTIASTAAVILAISMARAEGAPKMGRLAGALLLFGVAAYLPCTGGRCMNVALTPVALLTSAIPFFFWTWTQTIMDDEFELRPLPIVFGVAMVVLPFLIMTLVAPSVVYWCAVVHSVIGIGFVLAALVTVLRTWKQDLIESRRRLRAVVLVVSGTYTMVILIVEMFVRGTDPSHAALQLVNAALLALLLTTFASIMLGPSNALQRSFGWTSSPKRLDIPVQPAPTTVRDHEKELIDKLNSAMTGKGMYRDPEISIGALAKFAAVSEKQLREVINERMGHKNFPSFVNAFRVEEVRTRLGDPRNDHLPILTLALDAGFGSVVAFNRAFKERYAVTPTEFRAQRTAPTA